MKAVILAAGLGTRLSPFTDRSPKILAWLDGRTVLAHQLGYLARYGFTDVAINTHHFAGQVEAFISEGSWRTGSASNTEVELFYEETLLGTAGSLVPMTDFLGVDPFLVMYGDVIASFNLRDFAKTHHATATIACYPLRTEFGVATLRSPSGAVEKFEEKPDLIVNAGYYMLSRDVLPYIKAGDDFGYDTFPRLLEDDVDADVYAYPVPASQIVDVGTEAGLKQACNLLRMIS